MVYQLFEVVLLATLLLGHILSISHLIISITPNKCQAFPSEHDQWGTTAAHKAVVIFL